MSFAPSDSDNIAGCGSYECNRLTSTDDDVAREHAPGGARERGVSPEPAKYVPPC